MGEETGWGVINKVIMRKLILVFATVFLFVAMGVSQTKTEEKAVLKGCVFEAKTGKPIGYVNVIVYDTNGVQRNGASTDEKGEYCVEGIPYGKYRINFNCIGYEVKDVNIEIKKKEEKLSVGLKDSNIRFG